MAIGDGFLWENPSPGCNESDSEQLENGSTRVYGLVGISEIELTGSTPI